MEVSVNLILQCRNGPPISLADVEAAPAAGEVDESVPVQIFQERSFTLFDDERGVGSKWSCNVFLLKGKDSSRLGAGKFSFYAGKTAIDHIPPYDRQ